MITKDLKFKKAADWIGLKLGKYLIKEKLGRGGKGIVFKVLDTLEDRVKAIKVIPPELADSKISFKDLKREVKIASRIIHPNVVKVTGLECYEGQYFIVMEYVEGISLEEKLADSPGGKLDEQEVVDIMKKVAWGLMEVHERDIIHRDIKPSNITITLRGSIKILDFGISYQITKSMTQLVGDLKQTGTWPYMAPEQLSTQYGREDKQVDVWGFGVLAYQLLSGELPFTQKDQIREKGVKPFPLVGVSKELCKIVMKCLHKERNKRFQDFSGIISALNCLPQRNELSLPKVEKKAFRIKINKKLVWSLVSLVIVIGVIIGVSRVSWDSANQSRDDVSAIQEPIKQEVKQKEDEYKKFIENAISELAKKKYKSARENIQKARRIKDSLDVLYIENQINELEKKEEIFTCYLSKARTSYSQKDFNDALANIEEAKKININNAIEELERTVLKAQEDQRKLQDQKDWDKAKGANTISAYKAYLNKYHKGRYIAKAREELWKLKPTGKYPADVRSVAKKIGIENISQNEKGFYEADYGDGIIIIYIPAFKFKMGSNKGRIDEKPVHTVYLDGYWIGKYEVTIKQYMQFVNETKTNYPKWLEEGNEYNINTGSKDYYKKHTYNDNCPIVGISWHDAIAYCDWLSKKKGVKFKLPTEAQWEKAARGTTGRIYPWGNEFDKKLCNSGEAGPNNTTPVVSYPSGQSPFCCFNMAGNVWEWCADWFARDYYEKSSTRNPRGPDSGTDRVIRGGGWFIDSRFVCCACRFYIRPNVRLNDVGFRLSQELSKSTESLNPVRKKGRRR